MRSLCASLCILVSLASGLASAGTLYASRADKNEIWTIDTFTLNVQLVGGYTVVDPNELNIPALALGVDGRLFGLSNGQFSGSLYEFDKTTGAATELHQLQQPTGPLGMATNPADGNQWWINTGGFNPAPQLYDIDPNTFQVSFHGNVGSFSNWFSGASFAPDGNLYAIQPNANALWIVDLANPQGAGTQQIGAGFGATMDTSQGATLAYDGSVGLMFAYTVKDHSLFAIDVTTGTAQLYAPLSASDPTFASFTGDPCPGSVTPYGTGCPGSGGIVPKLEWTGCPVAGTPVQLAVTRGLGGSFAVLLLGGGQGNVPIGAGCSLLVAPLLPGSLTLPLSPGGPGQGGVALNFVMPPLPPSITFTMQALVADPATAIGGCVTNGVEVFVP